MDKPWIIEEPKETYQIKIRWGTDVDGPIEPDTYTFTTKQELDGFRLGIAVACGWSHYEILGEEWWMKT